MEKVTVTKGSERVIGRWGIEGPKYSGVKVDFSADDWHLYISKDNDFVHNVVVAELNRATEESIEAYNTDPIQLKLREWHEYGAHDTVVEEVLFRLLADVWGDEVLLAIW